MENNFSFSSETERRASTVNFLFYKRWLSRPRLSLRGVAAGGGRGSLEGGLVLVVGYVVRSLDRWGQKERAWRAVFRTNLSLMLEGL